LKQTKFLCFNDMSLYRD